MDPTFKTKPRLKSYKREHSKNTGEWGGEHKGEKRKNSNQIGGLRHHAHQQNRPIVSLNHCYPLLQQKELEKQERNQEREASAVV